MAKSSGKNAESEGFGGGTMVEVPELMQGVGILRLVGDSPMLVNNKMSVAWDVAARYSGDAPKTKKPPMRKRTPDEQYAGAFYVLPSSTCQPFMAGPGGQNVKFAEPLLNGLYGVPSSGVAKCLRKAIRTAGFTDNTTIGLIGKSFRVLEDEGGCTLLRHNGFQRDARPVNIGSGQKTVPDIRYRPLFLEWELHVKVVYNSGILSLTQLANLANHAGQYIGLCELRAEKGQGECGGFRIDSLDKVPRWATDEYWGVAMEPMFRVLKSPPPGMNGKGR